MCSLPGIKYGVMDPYSTIVYNGIQWNRQTCYPIDHPLWALQKFIWTVVVPKFNGVVNDISGNI